MLIDIFFFLVSTFIFVLISRINWSLKMFCELIYSLLLLTYLYLYISNKILKEYLILWNFYKKNVIIRNFFKNCS